MKPFAYVNPANEKDAVAALGKEHEKTMPIGGGQDLLARMKDYVTQPDRVVNVKNPMASPLLKHPLAQEAGGDDFHSGGRQFTSQSDAEWKAMADWIKGAK